jgi:5-methylcytosine-specific restriction endonuclease McrA
MEASNRVFVLDKHGNPLMPCHPARARELLQKGKAVVHRLAPFTIRLKERVAGVVQPVRIRIDPGSKVTGFAVARETDEGERNALWLGELTHRGSAIRKSMEQRSNYRHCRRSKNLRYRAPRFSNRRPKKGTLPPSLRHRVEITMSWVRRLYRWIPVTAISMELVRFDLQKMENPEISGVEYQQGELAGYEVREYLLEKWSRKCAYCTAEGVPLEIEHIEPRARGGSNRISNLAIACRSCNEKKGDKLLAVFLVKKPQLAAKILTQTKAPLRDAAAVNVTRWSLCNALRGTGIPIETGSGGRTKYNRSRFGLPKTHALDALCVGVVAAVSNWERSTLAIRAMGRGSYQRTNVDASGFPRGFLDARKLHHGFRTGDLVRAIVPNGKKAGMHMGRIAVRAMGRFRFSKGADGISYKHCRLLMRGDGYDYATVPIIPVANAFR